MQSDLVLKTHPRNAKYIGLALERNFDTYISSETWLKESSQSPPYLEAFVRDITQFVVIDSKRLYGTIFSGSVRYGYKLLCVNVLTSLDRHRRH